MNARFTRSCLVAIGLAGCGGSVKQPPPPPTTATFTITVRTEDGITPIGGAFVALDQAGADRHESPTESNGSATFNIDWSLGPVDVTAVATDRVAMSTLGITKADRFDLSLPSKLPPALVKVSGAIKNKDAATDEATLTASAPSSAFQDTAASYSLVVVPSRPFSLIGLDWVPGDPTTVSSRGIVQSFKKWIKIDQPAVASGSVTVDVDFQAATALTSTKVSGSVGIPGGASGPLGSASFGYFVVSTLESNGAVFLGAPTKIDAAADGNSFSWDAEYVSLDGQTPITTFTVSNTDGSTSGENFAGYPTTAPLTDLFAPPQLTAPATGVATQPLHTAIAWTSSASLAWSQLVIVSGAGAQGQVVWRVNAPGAAATLTVPQLPAGMDPATVLGSGALQGQLITCRDTASDVCRTFADSRVFGLTK
jgi:hypothetical protein